MLKKGVLLILLCSFIYPTAFSQQRPVIKEYEEEYVTYPFSDPNPIPVFGKIYPYFRFDGYTTQADKKSWKIV